MPLVASRYSLEERQYIASQMYIFGRATQVRNNFEKEFRKPPPSQLTIYRIHDKWKATGSVANNIAGTSGRRRSARVQENIVAVRRALEKNPKNSIRRLRNQVEVPLSYSTCQRILAKDLGLKPYRLQRHQALRPADKIRRKLESSMLYALSILDPDFENRVIFSDEATFHISGHVNHRNCIIWGSEKPTEIREHIRDSPKVNVWCAVTACGIIGPYFHKGTSVNGVKYLEMIEEFFFPNLPLCLRRDGYFQQDGAPCHFTIAVRNLLDREFGERWIGRGGPLSWPPYSPDLTPCDFWLWGVLKEQVYAKKIRNLDHLKEVITSVIETITPEMCRRAIRSAIERFDLCEKVNGDQVEAYIN